MCGYIYILALSCNRFIKQSICVWDILSIISLLSLSKMIRVSTTSRPSVPCTGVKYVDELLRTCWSMIGKQLLNNLLQYSAVIAYLYVFDYQEKSIEDCINLYLNKGSSYLPWSVTGRNWSTLRSTKHSSCYTPSGMSEASHSKLCVCLTCDSHLSRLISAA